MGDCSTTANEGTAVETPVGMQMFMKCPPGCGGAISTGNSFHISAPVCVSASQSSGSTFGGVFAVTIRSGDRYQIQVTTTEQQSVCVIPSIDCVGAFTACDASCGMKRYVIETSQSGAGVACPYAHGYEAQCLAGEGNCPPDVDCEGSWPACGTDCRPITYQINTPQSGSGRHCPHADGAELECAPGEGSCPVDRDCVGVFTRCDATCGTKIFQITTAQSGTGEPCEYADGHKIQCREGEDDCPVQPDDLDVVNDGSVVLSEDDQDYLLIGAGLGGVGLLLCCGLIFYLLLQTKRGPEAPMHRPPNMVHQSFYNSGGQMQDVQSSPQLLSQPEQQPEQTEHTSFQPPETNWDHSLGQPQKRPGMREETPRPQTPSQIRLDTVSTTPMLRAKGLSATSPADARRFVENQKRQRTVSALSANLDKGSEASRGVIEKFEAQLGEARELTTPDSRTQQWVKTQSQRSVLGAGLSDDVATPDAAEGVRVKAVQRVGSRAGASEIVLQARRVMAANNLRRQPSRRPMTPVRNAATAQPTDE